MPSFTAAPDPDKHLTNHFDWQQLQADLPGWQIDFHETLDSTNRYAVRLADQFQTPAVVIAGEQTAGRGRGQNRWWSAAGALTFSLVIRPLQWQISLREQSLLSLLTAAIVRESLACRGDLPASQLQLKWPNDLYFQGKKLCGILLEQSAVQPEVLVIGIGLNVNNSWKNAPEEVQDKGIALCDVLQTNLAREEILADILRRFAALLPEAERRQQFLRTAWNRHHLLEGQIVTLTRHEETLTGRCEGIDDDGALLVRDMFTLHRVHSAVVTHWESC